MLHFIYYIDVKWYTIEYHCISLETDVKYSIMYKMIGIHNCLWKALEIFLSRILGSWRILCRGMLWSQLWNIWNPRWLTLKGLLLLAKFTKHSVCSWRSRNHWGGESLLEWRLRSFIWASFWTVPSMLDQKAEQPWQYDSDSIQCWTVNFQPKTHVGFTCERHEAPTSTNINS